MRKVYLLPVYFLNQLPNIKLILFSKYIVYVSSFGMNETDYYAPGYSGLYFLGSWSYKDIWSKKRGIQ